jgi:lipid A 4'-phosphatase
MSARRLALLDWSLALVVLVGLTIPFWTTDLDLAMATRFYTPGAGWAHGGDHPWDLLYHYGVLPAWMVAVSALVVFVASFWWGKIRSHRRAALFLVLVMAVGPGLLTNNVFKEHWGRPRPRDLVEFNGNREYVKPWVKSARENGNSFASGHAATAFYLCSPYFLVRRRSKAWALFFLALGVTYGSLMGWARMVQGMHFLSDVLWGFGFVYLSGLALLYLLRLHVEPGRPSRA